MELKKIKLKKLFSGLPVKIMGNKELEVSGLSAHSKMVSPGDLFIAKAGMTHHGAKFVEEALHGGAVAILTDLFDPFCKEVTQIICENPIILEGEIAQRFFDSPEKKLSIIGITGTNGKTTSSYLARTLLEEKKCGLIGTIEYLLGCTTLPATFTTPDVITNHKMLGKMKERGLNRCIMEVTSHGLVQGRVAKISFDLAVFTNLSQDHLDYHKTFEEYLQAKALLFKGLSEDKTALINSDSPYAEQIIQNCRARIKTYAIDKAADYQAKEIKLQAEGTEFNLVYKQNNYLIKTPLVGQFNVYNTLVAIGIALESGLGIEQVLERIKHFKAPPGRMEAIPNTLGVQIFVDFAHTEDALKNVLTMLKQIKHKKIITVFGCGGDRDQEKRPLMGQTVSSFSDVTIITSDNPRGEDPSTICEAVFVGCTNKKNVLVEVDRKRALIKALELAQPGDIILVAGRGHESHQIIGRQRIPFQDAEVLKELLCKELIT